jgi:hypothetical protein
MDDSFAVAFGLAIDAGGSIGLVRVLQAFESAGGEDRLGRLDAGAMVAVEGERDVLVSCLRADLRE